MFIDLQVRKMIELYGYSYYWYFPLINFIYILLSKEMIHYSRKYS